MYAACTLLFSLCISSFVEAKIGEHESGSDADSYTHVSYNSGDFRLSKYNKIWERAQNLLNLDEQRRLYKEMIKLDKLALTAKHDEISGRKDLLHSSKDLDKKFVRLLKNFKLYELAESLKKMLDLGELEISSDQEKRFVDEKLIERDTNLLKLWHDAKSAGFSPEELVDLQQEFLHYAEKQENFRKRILDYSVHDSDPSRNLVTRGDYPAEVDSNESNPNVVGSSSKLKQENKLLNEDFNQLVGKVEIERVRSANGQLKNSKAKYLWEKALKSGSFDEQQLADLQTELKHFDNRLDKLRFVEDDMIKTKFKLNKMGKKEYTKLDEYDILDRKLKDYEKKAEKLESYLTEKIEL